MYFVLHKSILKQLSLGLFLRIDSAIHSFYSIPYP